MSSKGAEVVEQLNFFHDLYGDVAKDWIDGEKNVYGVYTENTHKYEIGEYEDRCRLQLKMCKSNGKLLFTHSLSFCDYGCASPLSDHCDSVTVECSADDVCRSVRNYLFDSIANDRNINKDKKEWKTLCRYIDDVVNMLRTDLTTNKRNNDEEQTSV